MGIALLAALGSLPSAHAEATHVVLKKSLTLNSSFTGGHGGYSAISGFMIPGVERLQPDHPSGDFCTFFLASASDDAFRAGEELLITDVQADVTHSWAPMPISYLLIYLDSDKALTGSYLQCERTAPSGQLPAPWTLEEAERISAPFLTFVRN
ncbi:MAG: hypothetical protein NDJ89_16805 [Oligoflexia bacterium]|nr:hypothetical protein [Oligoflexia bacterium]